MYSADGVNSHYFCFQCKCLHCAFEKTCKVCTDPEAWYEDVEEDDSGEFLFPCHFFVPLFVDFKSYFGHVFSCLSHFCRRR